MASFVPPMLSHVSWPIKDAQGTEINYLNVHVFVNSRPGTPQHEFAKNIYKVVLGYLSGGKSAPDDFINNSLLSIPAYKKNKTLFQNIMGRAPDFCGRSGMSTSYVSGSSTQNEYITVFITSTNGAGLIDPIFEYQPLHSVATMDITDNGKILYIDSFCGAPKKDSFFNPLLQGEWNNANSGSAQNLGGWRLMKLLLRACQLQGGIETVELMSMPHPDTLKFYENQGFINLDKGTKSYGLHEHTRPVHRGITIPINFEIITGKLLGKLKLDQNVLKAVNAFLSSKALENKQKLDALPITLEELLNIPMTKDYDEDDDNDWFTQMVNEKLGNSSGTSNSSAAEPNWNEIVTPTISRQNSSSSIEDKDDYEEDPNDWFNIQYAKLSSSASGSGSSKTSSSEASASEASSDTHSSKKGRTEGGSPRKTKRNSKKRGRTRKLTRKRKYTGRK